MVINEYLLHSITSSPFSSSNFSLHSFIVRLNYFLFLFLRVVPNQLGLKADPQGIKAPKAAKVPHYALTCQNQCSHSSLFSPQKLCQGLGLTLLRVSSTPFFSPYKLIFHRTFFILSFVIMILTRFTMVTHFESIPLF